MLSLSGALAITFFNTPQCSPTSLSENRPGEKDHSRALRRNNVSELLKAGFDPSGYLRGNVRTRRMLAAERGNLAVVEILLHLGSKTSITNRLGWSIIHFTWHAPHISIIHALRESRLDWNAKIIA
ncbi:hypothetical protein N7G274_005443 [Stereocaulon virgatum]|uniref:Ankyrin repeat protein n=1 Tax=Stereocaulon virgatum TaxID=373712 RepID=A0ABR4AA95_9LECA